MVEGLQTWLVTEGDEKLSPGKGNVQPREGGSGEDQKGHGQSHSKMREPPSEQQRL